MVESPASAPNPVGRGDALKKPVPEPRPGAATILVVDDEPVVRMLLVDLLREYGHAVHEAEDGHVAMAKLREFPAYDLMITDIGLPGGLDGSTLARQARVMHPALPILFITGYAFGKQTAMPLEPGIPVLAKPFTLMALATRVSSLLAAKGDPAAS